MKKQFLQFLAFNAALSIQGFGAIDYDKVQSSFRETLGTFVGADTSNPPGNEERIVELVAKKLKSAGIPYEVLEFEPGRKNIIARLKGTGKEKPLLLLAHIDVVGTGDQNWTTPPHTLIEKEGYLYGRGVGDDLGMATLELEELLTLKESHQPLRRDVILALTGDEESGGKGIRYVLEHRPDLVDAVTAINEGGGLTLSENGGVQYASLQVAEKVYRDFELVTEGTTGHSSVPMPNNSIYRLARALAKWADFQTPPHLIPVTRAYFQERAKLEPAPLAKAMRALADAKGKLPEWAVKEVEKNPSLAASLRTTCVATMLSGGTKVNALPPKATANINCRILPDESVAQVQARIESVINDKQVSVKPLEDNGLPATSPLEGEMPAAIKKVLAEMFPGAPIIPSLSKGATDSRFLRPKGIQSYGLNPLALKESDSRRAHGIDERIPTSSLRPGIEFFHKLVLELAADKS